MEKLIYYPAFKSTLNQVTGKYQLNPQMLCQWKSDFIKNAAMVFEHNKDEAGKLRKEMEEKESRYQQIIGQQSYEIDWLKKNWPQVVRSKYAKPWRSLANIKSALPGRPSAER
ncbi:Uncharacterized [Syntrophomonas zehnderi OL-4]|uniref:Uncharacterized n=1 Tax=Syntrophomonas zehnderi OL-4 TaxID=690567 RepID=A0A0E3W2G3_9FIRM|nr:hypothetical protein [Syntrophomonas zehnderi]CFW98076.1 Uncharacterized [Syntrophomonas zehnderi OL-4]